MAALQIIYWICVFAILHSYVFYSVILYILAKNKKDNAIVYTKDDDLPEISILLAVYNEEEVLEEKLQSMLGSKYPTEKVKILIGSDNSTDKTNAILEAYEKKYPSQIKLFLFTSRQGKAKIINHLHEMAGGEIYILTDANVMFDENTMFELIKHFKNQEIGIVDSNMINKGLNPSGISIQEKAYISREVLIKNKESKIWGSMMGPFGGCYAIRKSLYQAVPPNFLVDDFYINMKVLVQKKKAINNLHAKVYEDVSNNLEDEFRRKIRISTGNFQNLLFFRQLIFKCNGISFSFFSHKVLRWFGPMFLLVAFFTNILLLDNQLYYYLFYLYCLTFAIPIFDFILRKIKVHLVIFRFITHFYSMNLALLIGFYKFIKGVKSNVWQPTKRNQSLRA
ncbi:MAG: glycosyl transferase family 2 [Bacteroidia bacterium]|nr:MAG: glycosyl transferase family 2 [Bacteroidia bacterium]